jgi:hypothetical protein
MIKLKSFFFILFSGFILNAQSIRINEAVSSNSVYFDQDGDSPDWFELHNYRTQNVSLENWTISDDLEALDIIRVYPNPVKEKLYVSGNSSIYSVEILSLLGQNLIKVNNTNMVDLSVLNKGIYLIKIENNGITSTFKIIKQ